VAIGRILGNSSLAGSLGRAAAERARLFTSEETARRTEALYDQILESERPTELLRLRARRADTILEELLNRASRAATPTDPRPA
jgi:hypothetical protein